MLIGRSATTNRVRGSVRAITLKVSHASIAVLDVVVDDPAVWYDAWTAAVRNRRVLIRCLRITANRIMRGALNTWVTEVVNQAGGSLRTSTRPTLNLLLLLRAYAGYSEQALDRH